MQLPLNGFLSHGKSESFNGTSWFGVRCCKHPLLLRQDVMRDLALQRLASLRAFMALLGWRVAEPATCREQRSKVSSSKHCRLPIHGHNIALILCLITNRSYMYWSQELVLTLGVNCSQ
eukprot:1153133-Pelagomonas_calceolata.AAC.5